MKCHRRGWPYYREIKCHIVKFSPNFLSKCSFLGWMYNRPLSVQCHRYKMSQWTKHPVAVLFGSKCTVDVPLVDIPSRHLKKEPWKSLRSSFSAIFLKAHNFFCNWDRNKLKTQKCTQFPKCEDFVSFRPK
jgi:hypothetical protein